MRERFERILAGWGQVAYRHPRLTIGLVLAILVPIFTQLPRLELNTSTEDLLHADDPIRIAYDRFREQFGRDDRSSSPSSHRRSSTSASWRSCGRCTGISKRKFLSCKT